MKTIKAAEKAYVAYTKAMVKLHAKYYPTPEEPLVGDRSAYLDEWGRLTDRYNAKMRALGFPNY